MKRSLFRFVFFAFAVCLLALPAFADQISVSVSAQSAALICAETGEVYFSKNAETKLPMASTTKIMTALVALENSELGDTVQIDRRAVGVEGSSVYLTEGEILTMENLLYAMLLSSANDAAAAIAIEVGGSIEGFAQMMNEKVTEMGLSNSHFDNPHGLDSESHYTSALDLAKITAAAMKNETFLKIVSTYKATIPCDGGTRVLINHNKLLRSYNGAIGVKTGFTKRSGRCLVSAAERNGLTLIAVTINAPDDWNDHRLMLDAGFEAYHKITPISYREYKLSLPVVGGTEQTILCTNTSEISAIIEKSVSEDRCQVTVEAPRFLYAPVKKGDAVGKIICASEGKIIGETDLLAEYSIEAIKPKKTLFQKILDFFNKLF